MVPLELNERFGGIARLYGQAGLLALNKARVCVIGVGGVGSWVVEALARSGVGELTLVDLDEVCITNVNRQLPALEGSFGKFKVEELKTRVKNIFPACNVYLKIEFFNKKNYGEILKDGFDYVIVNGFDTSGYDADMDSRLDCMCLPGRMRKGICASTCVLLVWLVYTAVWLSCTVGPTADNNAQKYVFE